MSLSLLSSTTNLQHTSCGSDFAALNCWPLIFWSINVELVVVIQDITCGTPNLACADFIMLQSFVTTVRLEALLKNNTVAKIGQCHNAKDAVICECVESVYFKVQDNSMLESSHILKSRLCICVTATGYRSCP